jgi:hypothetical protein
VFAYGDAPYRGGATGLTVGTTTTALCDTADGDGYWITTNQGMVFALGSATDSGGMVGRPLNGPIIADAGF